jgi:putative flippase GtrA
MRFGRFTLVGVLGAAWQLFLVSVLTKGVHLTAVAATPVAVEMVILHNFLWHEHITWRDRCVKGRTAIRLWRFHAGNGLVSMFGNTLIVYCLVDRLKVSVTLSSMVAITCCSVANFLIADCWVYARVLKKDDGPSH